MASHSLKLGIDLPVMQQLAIFPPYYNRHGAAMVADGRRHIYFLYGNGATDFFRYDAFTDGFHRLAPAPVGAGSYGSWMAYCHVRRRIYVAFAGSTDFRCYDVDSDTWSAALTALPVSAYSGATLAHTCSGLHASGNDDYIYYVRGDGSERKLRRYSISGNSWSEVGTDLIPGAPYVGAGLFWTYGHDPDQLMLVRGNATRQVYHFSISGGSYLGQIDIKPCQGNMIYTGSLLGYAAERDELFWCEGASRGLSKFKTRLGAQETGTATGGDSTTLADSAKNWEEDKWFGAHVTITGGTGAGQTRQIRGNTATTLTVDAAWTTPPDATSTYEIKFTVFEYGAVTSATSNTLTDSSKAWLTNAYQYEKVRIVAGTGSGQEGFISSNTAAQLTVSSDWTVTPDATSRFEIIGYKSTPETQIPYDSSASYFGAQGLAYMPIKGLPFIYLWRKNSSGDWFRYLVTSP